ncbi:MAG: hypothetical protein RBR77_00030 [Thauera sp.]|nr:hypothetical protein [Thauera sp.]
MLAAAVTTGAACGKIARKVRIGSSGSLATETTEATEAKTGKEQQAGTDGKAGKNLEAHGMKTLCKAVRMIIKPPGRTYYVKLASDGTSLWQAA